MQMATQKLQSNAAPMAMIIGFAAIGLVTTIVGVDQPIIGAGIAYVVIFLVLAWRRPDIALMLCFAGAPLQNDLSGDNNTESHGKFSLAEVNIVLTCLVFIARRIQTQKMVSLGPVGIPMAAYFAVCIFSSIQSWRDSTVISMVQMVLYLIITLTVFAQLLPLGSDFHLCLYGLMVVGTFLASAALLTNETYILGLHKNGVGSSIASALVVGIETWSMRKKQRYRWVLALMVLVMAGGLLHTLSRGAWLATVTGIITISLVRRDYKKLIRLVLILGPLIAICWAALPDASKQYAMGFDSQRANIAARYRSMHIALDKFYESPVYGLGVGLRKEYDATNIVFALLAETGVVGLAAFLFIHVVLVVTMSRTQMQLTPRDPVYSLPALGAGLLVGKLCNGMVDHYWSRGALTMAWAAAGMGLSAYWYVQRRKVLLTRMRLEAAR
jgi:O-antigen ligase